MANGGSKKQAKTAKTKKPGKNSVSLVEKAYQQIKRMMFLNEVVAGQRLRYQDIAHKLGMSQTPVILALTRLENEGLVRSEAHKGFYLPEADREDCKELYEMRNLIETFLVRKTAKKITEDQLNKLQELMEKTASIKGESYPRERLWGDAQLHLTLASFSDHQVSALFLRQVFDRLYLMYRPERLGLERMLEAAHEHTELLQALKQRDGDKAGQVMQAHIKRGQRHILEGLEREVQFRNSFAPWG
jgi:DNA-binding GntR family transcriptional regulator